MTSGGRGLRGLSRISRIVLLKLFYNLEGCDKSDILNTKAQHGSKEKKVDFSEKATKIKTNPSLTPPPITVKVKVKGEERPVWSHTIR